MRFVRSISPPTSYPEPNGTPKATVGSSTITASSDGGFLDLQIVPDYSETAHYLGATRSIAQIIPAGGGSAGPAYPILVTGGPPTTGARVAELDGGGWLVAATLAGDPGFFGPRLQVQTLDPTGRPIAPPTVFGGIHGGAPDPEVNVVALDPVMFPTDNNRYAQWDYVARSDGSVVVFALNSTAGNHRILGQAFESSGDPVGERIVLPLDEAAFRVSARIGENGDIFITSPIKGILSAADGSFSIIPAAETAFSVEKLLSLDDTGFAFTWLDVTYSDYTTEATYIVNLQTGDRTGLNPATEMSYLISERYDYDVAALGNGLFALIEGAVHTLDSLVPVTVDVQDAQGWKYGRTTVFSAVELEGAPLDSTVDGANATVVDGDLLVWATAGRDDDARRIFKTVALPTDVDGTDSADTIAVVASSFVRAGDGDDRLTGSVENDVLDGGAGSDTLMGGAGNDILRLGGGDDVAHGGSGSDLAHVDIFGRMYQEHDRPAALDYADRFRLDPDGTLHLNHGGMAMAFRSVESFNFNGYTTEYRHIASSFFDGIDDYIDNSTSLSGVTAAGGDGADRLIGSAAGDRLFGGIGADQIIGGMGADQLHGGDGDDYIHGSDPLEDTAADRRDEIFAGTGNDTVFGGYGNDLIYGMDGDDRISGGYGADELIGQNGDDIVTGSAFGDIVFGNAGDDFVNGGFGHDLINGGTGADKFFHVGGTAEQMEGHGSDWVQDYSAAEGDVLVFGGSATASQFQVNLTHTASKSTGERSGDDDVQEAFVIYRPTGQILWALVDGGGQAEINLQIGGDVFDLMG